MSKCLVKDCPKAAVTRQICRPHYWKQYTGEDIGIKLPKPMTHSDAGRIGGSAVWDKPRPFASNRDLARRAGVIGGRNSKRGKASHG